MTRFGTTRRRISWPIVAVLLAALLAGIGTWALHDSNTTQGAAPASSAERKDVPTTPSGLPPYGCSLDASDKNDPLCDPNLSDGQRYDLLDYRDNFAGKPAYDCPQNAGLDADDIGEFVPCPNGAVHLRYRNGRLTVLNGRARITSGFDVMHKELPAPATGMHIAPYSRTSDDTRTTTWHLAYSYAPGVTPFKTYVLMTGKRWPDAERANVDDFAFNTGVTYEIVFTWSDMSPQRPASLPFKWCSMHNSDRTRVVGTYC